MPHIPIAHGGTITYALVHKRARNALPMECALSDGSCHGRLEVAFAHDTPAEFRRRSVYGGREMEWSVRVEDYFRLCLSHHQRYDKGLLGATLTEFDVRRIRRRVRNGETQVAMAREYGISTQRIHQIVYGVTWKHLPMGGTA